MRLITWNVQWFCGLDGHIDMKRIVAQAQLDLHQQACGHVLHPAPEDETGGPFQSKAHTTQAILCGDFNFETGDAEHGLIQAAAPVGISTLKDAWTLAHGAQRRVQSLRVDGLTQASDHQPVLMELA